MARTLELPMMLLLASCVGACATGAEGPYDGRETDWDATVLAPGDSGAAGNTSDGAARPIDVQAMDGNVNPGHTPRADAGEVDAGFSDARADTPDARADAQAGAADANAADASIESDTGMANVDAGGLQNDSGGTVEPDGSTGSDSGTPDASRPPVNCSAIVRPGVQLCDMGEDYCGAVFTNSSGCTATCAAAGMVCAMTYENVENQCARDETRPTLTCDSGHQSDYCVCRRP